MPELDNIGKRILHVLKENGQKPTPFEERKDISRGYLKRAADTGHGIGTEIVEKILQEFPGTDAYWLMTGVSGQPINGEKSENHTSGHKPGDNKENGHPSAEEVLNHLMEGDSRYVLINRELILEKYRLVSLEDIAAKEKEFEEKIADAKRKHEKDLKDLEDRKGQIAGLHKIISEITGKLPDHGSVKIEKA